MLGTKFAPRRSVFEGAVDLVRSACEELRDRHLQRIKDALQRGKGGRVLGPFDVADRLGGYAHEFGQRLLAEAAELPETAHAIADDVCEGRHDPKLRFVGRRSHEAGLRETSLLM